MGPGLIMNFHVCKFVTWERDSKIREGYVGDLGYS
jgi:hypothetical protein